jgi:hypothetical protein
VKPVNNSFVIATVYLFAMALANKDGPHFYHYAKKATSSKQVLLGIMGPGREKVNIDSGIHIDNGYFHAACVMT